MTITPGVWDRRLIWTTEGANQGVCVWWMVQGLFKLRYPLVSEIEGYWVPTSGRPINPPLNMIAQATLTPHDVCLRFFKTSPVPLRIAPGPLQFVDNTFIARTRLCQC